MLLRSRTVSQRRLAAVVLLLVVLLLSCAGPSPGAARATQTPVPTARATLAPPVPTSAVVYITADGHVHELAFTDAWRDVDLTAAARAPLAQADLQPWAYRRGSGAAVLFLSQGDLHICELRLEGSSWLWSDLTAASGAPLPAGPASGYVRADGRAAALYIAPGNHVCELRLEGQAWLWTDLTAAAGAPLAFEFTDAPFGYVRGDGLSAVLYIGPGDHVIELRLEQGCAAAQPTCWRWADLSIITGATSAAAPLEAYVRSDGITAVVYRGRAAPGHVYELRLESGCKTPGRECWKWSDLTLLARAPLALSRPLGYLRADGTNAVVFAAPDNRLYELRLESGWKLFELTSVDGARPGRCPVPYVRADGLSAVAYVGVDRRVQELRFDGAWKWTDLSTLAGSTLLPQSLLWAYTRVTFVAYLPLVARV